MAVDIKTANEKKMRKRIPVFKRQNVDQKKRVGQAWRKPRGIDNKLRIKEGGYGYLPKIGYRTDRKDRGLHPSGFREVFVSSLKDLLEAGKQKNIVVRVSAGVGRKKRLVFAAEARKLKLRLLNV